MGSTSKGIPYAEPNDPIDGHPAADKLQAEKIDELIQDAGSSSDQVAQDLADFESKFDGGDATQVLTKQTNADGDWIWADSQGGGGGGGDTYPGISTDDPNILGIGSDAALVVQPEDAVSQDANNRLVLGGDDLLFVPSGDSCFPTYQDLDDCNASQPGVDPDNPLVILGDNVTKPIRYAGAGRPDVDTGVHSSEMARLAAAPVGSVYTCTDPDDAAEKNLGARVWRKTTPTDWVCVDGFYAVLLNQDNTYFAGEDEGRLTQWWSNGTVVGQMETMGWDANAFRSGDRISGWIRVGLPDPGTGTHKEPIKYYQRQNFAFKVRLTSQDPWFGGTGTLSGVGCSSYGNGEGENEPISGGLYEHEINWKISTNHVGDDLARVILSYSGVTRAPWPTEAKTKLTREVMIEERIKELQTLAEEYPEKAEDLKEEIEALYNDTATGEIESK